MSLFESSVTSHGGAKRTSSSSSSRRRSRRGSGSRPSGGSILRSSSGGPHRAASAGGSSAGGGGGEAPAVEGYLDKYTEAAGKFSRRWFELDLAAAAGPCLRYSGSGGRGERTAMALERIRDIRPGFDLPTLTKSPNLEFQFTLSGSGRIVRLRAPTVQEAALWITTLEKECTPAMRRVAAARRAAAGGEGGGPSSLGGGWRTATDELGRSYYYNKRTGARQWEHPDAGASSRTPAEAGGGGSPSGGSPGGGAASPGSFGAQDSAMLGPSKPVYGRELDPPPKTGVRGHNLIELHIQELGFFGVSLDETTEPSNGRSYIRVSAVDRGSEAHRQLPQLAAGAYLHTVQGRAVGGLHASAIVNHLKERPLAISFSFNFQEVDEAAEEMKSRGAYPCPFPRKSSA